MYRHVHFHRFTGLKRQSNYLNFIGKKIVNKTASMSKKFIFHSKWSESSKIIMFRKLVKLLWVQKSIRVCQRLSIQPTSGRRTRAWGEQRASEHRWAGIRSHQQPS